MIKNIAKSFLKYILIFISLIFLFVALLWISSIFSSELIKNNVKESAKILVEETNNKEVYAIYRGHNIYLDNYTDALMINTAYSIDNSTPLYSSFMARKNYIPGKTTEVISEKVGELKSDSSYRKLNQVGELSDTVNGKVLSSFEYARYWHGYLSYLRPLLILFNVNGIRILFSIILILLGITLLYLIVKKFNYITGIIFLIGLIFVDYTYIGFSLQGTPVFIIMMIASIILLIKNSKLKHVKELFFVIGAVTNYFDFFTVPILTLGFPLIIYILLKKEEESTKKYFLDILGIILTWGIGYSLTWIAKWVLLYLIYNVNIFETVMLQVFYRTGGTEISFWKVLLDNSLLTIGGLVAQFVILLLIFKLENKKISKIQINKKVIALAMIAIIPFIWYFVVRNHSYYHSGIFVYRNLLLFLIALPLAILESVKQEEKA